MFYAFSPASESLLLIFQNHIYQMSFEYTRISIFSSLHICVFFNPDSIKSCMCTLLISTKHLSIMQFYFIFLFEFAMKVLCENGPLYASSSKNPRIIFIFSLSFGITIFLFLSTIVIPASSANFIISEAL